MGLMNAFEIGRQGLSVHGKRVEIAAKNIANIDTPNYTRKIPIISSNQDQSFATVLSSMGVGALQASGNLGGVNFDGIVEDPTPGTKIYKPGHPDADEMAADGSASHEPERVLHRENRLQPLP